MIVRAYIYHKRAEKYSDCQDCFGIDSQNNRVAISDGMSQSIFPQWWAKILVDSYLETGHFPKDIKPLQEEWQKRFIEEIHKREEQAKTDPKRDPWRLKNSLAEKSGAGATLCGITFGDGDWMCECLGDSCLIAVNEDYSLKFYTSQDGEFGNHPDYFDSFSVGRGKPVKRIVDKKAKALILVTDPFAELFQLHKDNTDFIKERFREIKSLDNHNSFIGLVERWRDEFNMHNDDSTLVLIENLSDSRFVIEYEDNLSNLCSSEDNKEKTTSSGPKDIGVNQQPVTLVNNKIIDKEEAKNRFLNSFESFLPFYTGKRSKTGIQSWLRGYISPFIDKYMKQ